MKAIIKYPGSKWGSADWIISHFPDHHSYLEPFFGSGAVFFNKPRSHIETVNDLDENVVALFKWMRDDPERLAHEIHYTPYSRQIHEGTYRVEPADSLEKAVQFCIRLCMGHGFRTNGERVGWKRDIRGRERAYAALDWKTLPERLYEAAERLRGVQIEHRPAIDLIKSYNYENVLIYCDPPYMLGTRHGRQYRYEMDDRDHEELLDALVRHRGPAVISGYGTDLYDSVLAGWDRYERTSYTQSRTKKQEVIWMNYKVSRKETEQMSMFRNQEDG